MEYTPKSDGRTADYLIIGFFAVAVCAFAVSSSGIPFRGLVQIAGLVSLTVCLYLAIRYRFTVFRYVVADDGGEEVFEVYRTQGRRSIAECRMSLSYLRLAAFYSSNRELKKALRGCTFYRYTVSVAPPYLTAARTSPSASFSSRTMLSSIFSARDFPNERYREKIISDKIFCF